MLGKQAEGTREEQVTNADRSPAARGGGHRGVPTAQWRSVEDIVVDQGRHVNQLDCGRGPYRLLLSAGPGTKQDKQRPQPLAASRKRRFGVSAKQLAMATALFAQALLHLS